MAVKKTVFGNSSSGPENAFVFLIFNDKGRFSESIANRKKLLYTFIYFRRLTKIVFFTE